MAKPTSATLCAINKHINVDPACQYQWLTIYNVQLPFHYCLIMRNEQQNIFVCSFWFCSLGHIYNVSSHYIQTNSDFHVFNKYYCSFLSFSSIDWEAPANVCLWWYLALHFTKSAQEKPWWSASSSWSTELYAAHSNWRYNFFYLL